MQSHHVLHVRCRMGAAHARPLLQLVVEAARLAAMALLPRQLAAERPVGSRPHCVGSRGFDIAKYRGIPLWES